MNNKNNKKIYSDNFLDGSFDSSSNSNSEYSNNNRTIRNTLWEKQADEVDKPTTPNFNEVQKKEQISAPIAQKVFENRRNDNSNQDDKSGGVFEFVSPMHGKQENKAQFPVTSDENVQKRYDFIRPETDSRSNQEKSYAEKYHEFKPYLVGVDDNRPSNRPTNYTSYANPTQGNATYNTPQNKPYTPTSTRTYTNQDNDNLQHILHNESALNFFSKSYTKDNDENHKQNGYAPVKNNKENQEPNQQQYNQPNNYTEQPNQQQYNQPNNYTEQPNQQQYNQPNNYTGQPDQQQYNQPNNYTGQPNQQQQNQPNNYTGQPNQQQYNQPNNYTGQPSQQQYNQPNNYIEQPHQEQQIEHQETFSVEKPQNEMISSYQNDVEQSYFGGNVNTDDTTMNQRTIEQEENNINIRQPENESVNLTEETINNTLLEDEHDEFETISNEEVNKTVFEEKEEVKVVEIESEITEEEVNVEVKTFEEPAMEEEVEEEPQKTRVSKENASKINDIFSKKPKEEEKIAGADPIIPNDFAYKAPHIKLLEKNTQKLKENKEWLAEKAEVLNTTFRNFGVGATVVSYTYGPTVTRFEIEPEPGIKVSKITSLQDDIKLSLAAQDIRIEAPIPGRSSVGIEIPNVDKHIVRFRNVMEQQERDPEDTDITVCLGIDLNGNPIIKPINKMPHALIAGATGSGKSVCINTIIVSILYNCSPEDVRLLLIDPKMVELAPYNKVPHLLTPVITDYKIAPLSLKWAVDEMEERYKKLAAKGVRDITSYNKALSEGETKMPFIVIIIDELADLMMVSSNEVENYIMRIAQKARAAGIHLILATQRPSVNVITGTIKTNIPTRIAFTVSSYTDSRTILDVGGAERLLGKGDMLYSGSDMPIPVRLQGAFINDDEINAVTSYVAKKNEPLEYLFDHDQIAVTPSAGGNTDLDDDLFEEVCRFAIEEQSISTSRLQRRFQIGFNRAARLIDMMEDVGIVSEKKGSKPRDVLVSHDEFNEIMSNQ